MKPGYMQVVDTFFQAMAWILEVPVSNYTTPVITVEELRGFSAGAL